MKKNNTTIVLIIVIVGLLVFLFAWPRISDPHKEQKRAWKEVGVGCLSGHANAAQHIHPHLTILVDATNEAIPANIGVVTGCMAELHTHDTTGTLHVESIDAGKKFTLDQFLKVWGKSLAQAGYKSRITVDGRDVTGVKQVVFEDKQRIILEYFSPGSTPGATTTVPASLQPE